MLGLSVPSASKLPLPSIKPSNRSRQNLPSSSSPPNPNSEPLNHRLIHQLDVGHLHKAISTLDLMAQKGIHQDLTTTPPTPSSSSPVSGPGTFNSENSFTPAKSIFDNMGDMRDLVSWSAMVSCFANNDLEYEAIVTFLDMLENGLYPNEYCFAAVIRACSNAENISIGQMIFGFVIKSGYFGSDVCVGCALIDTFAKGGGDLDLAYKVFEKMPEKNTVTWTLMITSVQRMDLWMIQGNLFDLMVDHNVMSWTAIITGYVQSGGRDEEAVKLFCEMIKGHVSPNHFTFSSVLKACANLSDPRMGEQVYTNAVKLGIGVSAFTFASLLSGAASIGAVGKGEQIHARVLKSGFESNQCICNALISMYARCGNIEAAFQVFNYMGGRNVISWTSMITGFAKHGSAPKAMGMFHKMLEDGLLGQGDNQQYYVQEINYNNYTIRIVDSGIQKDNYSSTPTYSLNHYKVSSFTSVYTTYQPKRTKTNYIKHKLSRSAVFLSCETPVNSPFYLDASACIDNGDQYAISNSSKDNGDQYSSNTSISHSKSKRHRYVRVGTTTATDVGDSCKVEQMFLTSWPGNEDPNNISRTDVLNELVYGFELSWLQDYCPSYCRGDNSICFIDDANHVQCLYFSRVLHHAAVFVLGTPFVIVFLIQIRKITKGFKDKLGERGYGSVYKGKAKSGRLVAIKMLCNPKANGQEFISEVATIGRIQHTNVVQLIGFCAEGPKRALIYEFMPNGSLEKYIFSREGSSPLSIEKTYEISRGVAHGIEYLHQGCDMQILHFDIKPHNILLDENFTPKVSDFGLAKLYPADGSIVSLTAARGTLGYIAPELFFKNIRGVSYKADVYSFGMLLMEMAGRRKNLNAFADHSSQIYFPTWVFDQFSQGNDIGMEDATEEEKKTVKKMILVALWCIQMKPNHRPSMKKVVEMLEGEVESLQMPPKPFLTSPQRSIGDVGDSICSSIQSGMEDASKEEKKIVQKMILVALWCIQMKPSDRPLMNRVVEMLEGEVECLQMPSKPFLSSSPQRSIGDVGDPICSSIQSGESSQSAQL
uniref:Protein kinase domain-containing protein n=1 Tax=Fagus sylvatica TaxID=28930 RepID=A0A2N9G7I0_FAGSY